MRVRGERSVQGLRNRMDALFNFDKEMKSSVYTEAPEMRLVMEKPRCRYYDEVFRRLTNRNRCDSFNEQMAAGFTRGGNISLHL
jgi:hypothetical protein